MKNQKNVWSQVHANTYIIQIFGILTSQIFVHGIFFISTGLQEMDVLPLT